MATSMSAELFIDNVCRWAEVRNDILTLAVVGSHARGEARADSDIDLVLICSDQPVTWLTLPGRRRSARSLVSSSKTGDSFGRFEFSIKMVRRWSSA